jgi:hypothetical protein
MGLKVAVKRGWLVAALALSALSALAAGGSLKGLIDAVVRNGPASQIPAHLAVVLGVTTVEQSIPVKQAVVRDGTRVRTFNVSTSTLKDVVIMSYDESSRSMKAYFLSAAGELRTAVSYRAGEPAIIRPLAEARLDFDDEMKFWMNFKQKSATAN